MSKSHRDDRVLRQFRGSLLCVWDQSWLREAFVVGNTYTSLYIHCIFSTKQRLPLIVPEIQDRLWPYMVGIARQNNMTALAVGGISDHIHMLLSLPATLSVSKGIQMIKGNSSKWINETFMVSGSFSWQKGYGAFSVSMSMLRDTIRYIKNQPEHHRRKSFKEEYLDFLKRNKVVYDERYVWS